MFGLSSEGTSEAITSAPDGDSAPHPENGGVCFWVCGGGRDRPNRRCGVRCGLDVSVRTRVGLLVGPERLSVDIELEW